MLDSATQAEALACQLDAPRELAQAVASKGWALYRLRRLDSALTLGHEALALSTALGAYTGMILGLRLMGAILLFTAPIRTGRAL